MGAINCQIPNLNSNTRIVFYHQGEWKLAYGSGTISSCGCAICSFSMALSYVTGAVWTPESLLNWIASNFGTKNKFYYSGQGTDTGGMLQACCPKLGLSVQKISHTNIVSELLLGHPVLMSCKNAGRPKGDRLYWTGGTHIVLLSGVDKDTGLIYCHNCSHPDLIANMYSPSEVNSIVNNGYWAIMGGSGVAQLNRMSLLNFNSGSDVLMGVAGGASLADPSNAIYNSGAYASYNSSGYANYLVINCEYHTEFETRTIEYDLDQIKYAEQTYDAVNTSLLSYPNLVEAPFVQLKVGEYIFGTYKKLLNGYQAPNYILNLNITKINGEVNLYTVQLLHKIEAGVDPNIVDKILSSVGIGGKVYFSYGDYNEPSYTYKEEEAILLKSTSQVDFKSSTISYTLTCASNATILYARLFSFDARKALPSAIIKEMLYDANDKYGLMSAFPGMKDKALTLNFISSDDKVVDIPAKIQVSPLAYLNFLVTYMCANTNTDDKNPLKDSTYKLCLYDSTNLGTFYTDVNKSTAIDIDGAYFKVIKVSANAPNSTLSVGGVYEVDIGFPSTGNVMNFAVKEDLSWAILYNYAGDIKETVYNIDEKGELTTEYLPKLAISKSLNKMTEALRTWWTNMTEFPIRATLTLKGLVTPVLLMDYVRINALFYGQRHTASGLYVITALKDTVSSAGYRTTLELLRIAGDNAYIEKVHIKKEISLPVSVVSNQTILASANIASSTAYLGGSANAAVVASTYLPDSTNSTVFLDASGNNVFDFTNGGNFACPYTNCFTYMGWLMVTSTSSELYKWRLSIYPEWVNGKDAPGCDRAFDNEGFGIVNGRYVVAVTARQNGGIAFVGNELDVYLDNGKVLPCVVGDIKNAGDALWTRWGHLPAAGSSQCCTIEFIVNRHNPNRPQWYSGSKGGHANPGTSGCHPEWKCTKITKIVVKG